MTTSFKEAYGVLQRHSEALRQQREPNIDELLTVVEESVEAYKVCKTRIAAVEAALEKALGDVAAEAGAQPGASQDHQRP
jgi:exodeoxyribonuclease VII small subunit